MKYKVHKKYYSCGSVSVCGRTAYSQEHSKESWKGVDCKDCLRLKKTQKEPLRGKSLGDKQKEDKMKDKIKELFKKYKEGYFPEEEDCEICEFTIPILELLEEDIIRLLS